MYSNTLINLAAVGLLSLLPAIAFATPPTGTWRGAVTTRNQNVGVTIQFNGNQAHVYFDEPLSCKVPAKILTENGSTTSYRIAVAANGGRFCDSLLGRNLNVTVQSDSQLHVGFDSPKGAWQGDLRRASP
jgi:hypothetical protein